MGELVSTAEAARILGVGTRTVYWYARDYPDFPEPDRFGRALVWDSSKLLAWRQQHPGRDRSS